MYATGARGAIGGAGGKSAAFAAKDVPSSSDENAVARRRLFMIEPLFSRATF
jgi:hypothetical protein